MKLDGINGIKTTKTEFEMATAISWPTTTAQTTAQAISDKLIFQKSCVCWEQGYKSYVWTKYSILLKLMMKLLWAMMIVQKSS